MNRGDVILVRFPHPSGLRGKKRPAVVVVNTSEGKATGLVRDSVVSCLLLATIDASTVAQVLGKLSTPMRQQLNDCLKVALQIS